MFTLPESYSYKLQSLNRGINSAPITNSCNAPYRMLVIDYNSNCFICNCDGWLPIPVGTVQDFDSLEEVWNSNISKLLQNDIDNKKFTWCAVDHCGIKEKNIYHNIYRLYINIDESCNLACPSCRRELINHTDGPIIEKKLKDVEKIMSWLEKFEQPIEIVLSGNGDPLASTIIRPLIKSYKPKKNQSFRLFTNGLLLKKQLNDSMLLPNILLYSISIDAGSKIVYEKVRKGGRWEVLIENFEYLKNTLKAKNVLLNYAVQNNNFLDLYNFVELCNFYNFKGLIHQLDDWGTWNYDDVKNPDTWTLENGTYLSNNVLNKNHKNFNHCREVIQSIIEKNYSFINFSPKLKSLIS